MDIFTLFTFITYNLIIFFLDTDVIGHAVHVGDFTTLDVATGGTTEKVDSNEYYLRSLLNMCLGTYSCDTPYELDRLMVLLTPNCSDDEIDGICCEESGNNDCHLDDGWYVNVPSEIKSDYICGEESDGDDEEVTLSEVDELEDLEDDESETMMMTTKKMKKTMKETIMNMNMMTLKTTYLK